MNAAHDTGDDTHARAQQVRPEESRLGIIWIAMMVAVLLYGGLAYVFGPKRALGLDRELETWITIFLAMGSGLHVLVVFLLRQMIAALSGARYLIYCVLRWALMETVAVYGLVLAFLGVGFGITSMFFALSLLLLGSARPGPADRAVFVAQFR